MGMAREQKLRRESAVIGEREDMNVNCVNIGGRGLNITNMNLLIRFSKTREIFPSVTQVLDILLTISAISATVERANFRECVA